MGWLDLLELAVRANTCGEELQHVVGWSCYHRAGVVLDIYGVFVRGKHVWTTSLTGIQLVWLTNVRTQCGFWLRVGSFACKLNAFNAWEVLGAGLE